MMDMYSGFVGDDIFFWLQCLMERVRFGEFIGRTMFLCSFDCVKLRDES